MNIYRALCTSLLLCASQLANATGGAVNLTLDQLFKQYEVQTVFIGEVRGFERSQVHGKLAAIHRPNNGFRIGVS